jgi:hypothetical protein
VSEHESKMPARARKTALVAARFTPEQYRQIKIDAARHNRSISNYIAWKIEQSLHLVTLGDKRELADEVVAEYLANSKGPLI